VSRSDRKLTDERTQQATDITLHLRHSYHRLSAINIAHIILPNACMCLNIALKLSNKLRIYQQQPSLPLTSCFGH